MSSQDLKLIKKVKDAIEQVRPYLQADGGNIDFIELTDDNVVKVELLGACSTCPMGMMTLKQGVEETVKKAVPEIKSVEAVNFNF
ncbi:MAG: NifU family protein [Bacteroidales bacterium]|nr:NifU family protein [Bacteroidales bacterium]